MIKFVLHTVVFKKLKHNSYFIWIKCNIKKLLKTKNSGETKSQSTKVLNFMISHFSRYSNSIVRVI